MKRYDEYKQTGTPWIGEIPSHWEVKRGKFVSAILAGFAFNSDHFTTDEGYMPLIRIRDINNTSTEMNFNGEYPKEYIIKKGDILIGMDGDFNVAKWNGPEALLNQRVCKIEDGKEMLADYAYYLLPHPLQLINDVCYATTVKHLSTYDVMGEFFPVPPIEEQKSIISYLDKKCGSIDTVISTQERRIALLEELKQSVITEAVTHGINPDAKLRPSGIDWIGNIPEHWEVMPLKRTMRICNGADYKHIEAEDGYPVIGSGGIFAYASDYLSDGEALLLGRKGTIDKPLYFKGKFWTVDTMFYSIPQKFIVCKYMYYQSLNFPFDRYSTSTALPSMTSRDLGNNDVCVPPLSEQEEIVKYIESKIKPIDASIAKAKREIELLKELKQSVITEAVTGKIKVC